MRLRQSPLIKSSVTKILWQARMQPVDLFSLSLFFFDKLAHMKSEGSMEGDEDHGGASLTRQMVQQRHVADFLFPFWPPLRQISVPDA